MMSAVNVRDSRDVHGTRATRARLELVRLINLTHVLVCIMADSANKVYAKSALQKCASDALHLYGSAAVALHLCPLSQTMLSC